MIRILFIGCYFLFATATFAQQNKSIFWTSHQGVFRASLEDREPQILVNVVLQLPNHIVLDTLNQQLYWTDGALDRIGRSNIDGTNPQHLVTTGQFNPADFNNPQGLSLDLTAGKMYWVNKDLGAIYQANLDGSDEKILVEDRFNLDPVDTALDLDAGKVYWLCDSQGKAIVQRANLDGTEVEDILTDENRTLLISFPQYLELDTANNKLYIAGSFSLYRSNLDGTEQEEVVSGSGDPRGFTLDRVQNKMYWISDFDGQEKLRRANIDGSEQEELFSFGLISPYGLALDTRTGSIYWADWRTNQIQKANLDGTDIQPVIGPGDHLLPRGIAWHPASNQLFWGDWEQRRLLSIDIATHEIDSLVTTDTGLGFGSSTRINGIDINNSEGKVYWASPNANTINYRLQRSNLDGSNIEDILTEDDGFESNGIDLKVDPSGRYVYWTQQFFGGVQRASIDGGPIENLDRDSEVHVIGIAIDSLGQKIYWTQERPDGLNTRRSIVRADLDGSNREELVAEGLYIPVGIALDLDNQKMYWADLAQNMIRRANLDGTDVEDVISTYQPRWITVGTSPSLTNISHSPQTTGIDITNYPNPFVATTTLEYTLETPQHTRIAVYDLLGREHSVLVDTWQLAGNHKLTWNSQHIPAGMYFIRIITDHKQTQIHSVIKAIK